MNAITIPDDNVASFFPVVVVVAVESSLARPHRLVLNPSPPLCISVAEFIIWDAIPLHSYANGEEMQISGLSRFPYPPSPWRVGAELRHSSLG